MKLLKDIEGNMGRPDPSFLLRKVEGKGVCMKLLGDTERLSLYSIDLPRNNCIEEVTANPH